MSPNDYVELAASPLLHEHLIADEIAAVLVEPMVGELPPLPAATPVVVAGVGPELGAPGPAALDVVVGEAEVGALSDLVQKCPLASITLAVLLREMDARSVEAGLAAESAAYSVLQAGPEFGAWRAAHPATPPAETGQPVVRGERAGDRLVVTLDRPHRHNAITAALRDELVEILALALVDDTIAAVELRGAGPSFCSGGDLDEFGQRPDPATAHRTRLARSPARIVHALRHRTTAHVHGATLGGGAELAAFAGRIVAHPDTRFGLPETGLGLIPGAGGTVSMTRRMGRQRVAALALTGRTIDAATARRWGLVDELTS